MSELTEKSIREELGLDINTLSGAPNESSHCVAIPARSSYTFVNREGDYNVFVTNVDNRFNANRVSIYHQNSGNLVKRYDLNPLETQVAKAKMTENGIRVYNTGSQPQLGRPTVYAIFTPVLT